MQREAKQAKYARIDAKRTLMVTWCKHRRLEMMHWNCESDNSRGIWSSSMEQLILGDRRELSGLSRQLRCSLAVADTGFRMYSWQPLSPPESFSC